MKKLTNEPGYDAEATVSPAGDRVVFTSMRDGDLDIYSMNLDGSDVQRLTDAIGYDGGPFYSPDGTKIVYRARHPEDPQEIADYQALLADGLIRPSKLEIWVMDADGGNKRQITDLGVAAFAPFFTPIGRTDHLLVEPWRPERSRVQPLHGRCRWRQPRTDHLRRWFRRLPHVRPRWRDLCLLLESEQHLTRGRPMSS